MDDLELMRHITIGQYMPTGSFLHRLDPRAKIIGFSLLVLAAAVVPSLSAILVALLGALGLVALARVRISYALGGLRPVLPVLLLLAVLQLLFGGSFMSNPGCQTLWAAWIIRISDCSVVVVLTMLVRMTVLILLTSLLTMTSSISELTNGTESLLRPFQRFGLPAHELAMVITLALRFVPTLTEELEKLLKAQAARGADIRLGANPIQRTRHFLPVLVPLFLTTLERVNELAEAMTARGYTGGKGRSHYQNLNWTGRDGLALICSLIFALFLFIAPFQEIDDRFLRMIRAVVGL